MFKFSKDIKLYIRCGILLIINSVYDFLGFFVLVFIKGKFMFRELIRGNVDWDEVLF